ncbi:MAG: CvpA family protein, partial [Armatimonadetes bacterium]|nr:CvpA family protein [Armatimonadota bacterium]
LLRCANICSGYGVGQSGVMNQVDFLILVVVGGCALSGARRGIISSAGDIISLLLGLVLGAIAYPLAAAPVRWVSGASPAVAGALGFVFLSVLVVAGASWGFSMLSARCEIGKKMSRAGGAGFGAAFGIFFAAILVMASALLPGSAEPVSKSRLASSITALVPRLHENFESVGIPLPKLVQLPTDYRDELQGINQGRQFLRINFTRMDGAMCINCRSAVDFQGYQFSRGTLMSPKFRCPECGRTSDGCQSFEGFHEIYGSCPTILAAEGLQFDCGVWTNGSWTVPHGPCPVCGKEFRPESAAPH